jgi:hypothetical protein
MKAKGFPNTSSDDKYRSYSNEFSSFGDLYDDMTDDDDDLAILRIILPYAFEPTGPVSKDAQV